MVDSRSREDNGDRFIRHLEEFALFLMSTTNTIEVFKFWLLECAANVEGSHCIVLNFLCLPNVLIFYSLTFAFKRQASAASKERHGASIAFRWAGDVSRFDSVPKRLGCFKEFDFLILSRPA